MLNPYHRRLYCCHTNYISSFPLFTAISEQLRKSKQNQVTVSERGALTSFTGCRHPAAAEILYCSTNFWIPSMQVDSEVYLLHQYPPVRNPSDWRRCGRDVPGLPVPRPRSRYHSVILPFPSSYLDALLSAAAAFNSRDETEVSPAARRHHVCDFLASIEPNFFSFFLFLSDALSLNALTVHQLLLLLLSRRLQWALVSLCNCQLWHRLTHLLSVRLRFVSPFTADLLRRWSDCFADFSTG